MRLVLVSLPGPGPAGHSSEKARRPSAHPSLAPAAPVVGGASAESPPPPGLAAQPVSRGLEADPSLRCCRLGAAGRRDTDDATDDAGRSGRPVAVALLRRMRVTARPAGLPEVLPGPACPRGCLRLGRGGLRQARTAHLPAPGCQQPSGGCGTSGFPCSWFALESVSWDFTPHRSALIKVDPARCCLVGWGPWGAPGQVRCGCPQRPFTLIGHLRPPVWAVPWGGWRLGYRWGFSICPAMGRRQAMAPVGSGGHL